MTVLGIDDRLVSLGDGNLWVALLVAILLGIRHATDPDHLTAVTTLVLSDDEIGTRRAGRLGLSWGLGHGTTLLLLGLPVVLFNEAIPGWAQRAAEALIGVVIMALAMRLLVRWRRGSFHAHPHEHDAGRRHEHPHYHPSDEPHVERAHRHAHEERLGRTPLAAYGIGTLHGAGGSAGAGILLVATVPGTAAAAVALVLFAVASALSMSLASMAWARVLVTPIVFRRLVAFTPVFGVGGVLFGSWYGLGAFG